jgi:oligopeptide/dipeptide ABC transporter ATP-binding protein
MYAGRIVETGDVFEVFHAPAHPYTVGLMRSFRPPEKGGRLQAIPGSPPNLLTKATGCSFQPRCELGRGRALCVEEAPVLRTTTPGHVSACHYIEEVVSDRPIVSPNVDEP